MIDISKVVGFKGGGLRLDLVSKRIDAPTIIFSSGFLTANDEEWAEFLSREFPNYQCIRAQWNSGSYHDVTKLLTNGLGETVLACAVLAAGSAINPVAAGLFGRVLLTQSTGAVRLLHKAHDLWASARRESELAGKQLANVLNAGSYHYRSGPLSTTSKVIVMGHSLGARLMVNCLNHVKNGAIESAVFLGGAADARDQVLRIISKKTNHGILNIRSSNDDVLKWLYRLGNLRMDGAIGRTKILGRCTNIDATQWVTGHGNYCNNKIIAELMRKNLKIKHGGKRHGLVTVFRRQKNIAIY